MTGLGVQTQDFVRRLNKFAEELPPLLLELGQVMLRMIEEVERPQLEDILTLQADLRRRIGEVERLRDICGTEGELCPRCPFGAYLPSGFAYASESRALCLPWIVLAHPRPARPRAAG